MHDRDTNVVAPVTSLVSERVSTKVPIAVKGGWHETEKLTLIDGVTLEKLVMLGTNHEPTDTLIDPLKELSPVFWRVNG